MGSFFALSNVNFVNSLSLLPGTRDSIRNSLSTSTCVSACCELLVVEMPPVGLRINLIELLSICLLLPLLCCDKACFRLHAAYAFSSTYAASSFPQWQYNTARSLLSSPAPSSLLLLPLGDEENADFKITSFSTAAIALRKSPPPGLVQMPRCSLCCAALLIASPSALSEPSRNAVAAPRKPSLQFVSQGYGHCKRIDIEVLCLISYVTYNYA